MPDPRSRIVAWYRRLLLLFPFEFRRDYGNEMSGVFAEQYQDCTSGGPMPRIRLWIDTLAGALRVGPKQHLAVLRQDAGYAVRTLRASPLFTIAAVVALGLGVGANAAIFGLVNAVILRPFAIHEPSRVLLVQLLERKDARYTAVSTDNFRDIRERQRSFEQFAAFSFAAVTLQRGAEPEELTASVVTGNYFDLLGVPPAVGRAIRPDEDRDDAGEPVAVLSHRLWTRLFAGDRNVAGQAIRLNGQVFTVVGVAAASFRGTFGLVEPDLYVPLGAHEQLVPGAPWSRGRLWRWLNIVGRLAPGVTEAEARAEMTLVGDQLAAEFPEFNRGRTLAALPLNRVLAGPNDFETFARAGWLLMALVVVVLLVACLNLANLMLARAVARARDLALRVALGASRVRVVRQVLTESLILGLAGGAAGLLFAHWTYRALWALRPATLDQPGFAVELTPAMLVFTLAASVAASLLFGLAPAAHVSRTDVTRVLNEGGRQPGLGRGRVRSAFVVAEVAMAVVAVVAAGLFVRGMRQAQEIDPGFETDGLTVMNYSLPGQDFDGPRARQVHQEVTDQLAAAPGVRSAAVSDRGLLQPGIATTINVVGQEPPPDALGFLVDMARVTPDYFTTLRIAVVGGRAFDRSDGPGTRGLAVVNEAMARRFWPDRDALGQRFTANALGTDLEVVGIVADAKYESLGESALPFFYLPLLALEAAPNGPLTLFVASEGPAAESVARAVLNSSAPGVAPDNVRKAEELIGQALWAPRTIATLVSGFGALALLLAMIGVYSVMAYNVTQRRQEIGLRMALGATPRGILALVLGHGMALAAVGIVAGAAVTLSGASVASGLLYGISPRDPLTFAAVAAVLGALTLLACYVPARRAARTDPAITLRG